MDIYLCVSHTNVSNVGCSVATFTEMVKTNCLPPSVSVYSWIICYSTSSDINTSPNTRRITFGTTCFWPLFNHYNLYRKYIDTIKIEDVAHCFLSSAVSVTITWDPLHVVILRKETTDQPGNGASTFKLPQPNNYPQIGEYSSNILWEARRTKLFSAFTRFLLLKGWSKLPNPNIRNCFLHRLRI